MIPFLVFNDRSWLDHHVPPLKVVSEERKKESFPPVRASIQTTYRKNEIFVNNFWANSGNRHKKKEKKERRIRSNMLTRLNWVLVFGGWRKS